MSVSCTLHHAVAPMADGTEERVPYWHLDSGQPGEVFLVLAEQHGIELHGCEVVRRFREVALEQLRRGALYLVPFAHPMTLRTRRAHLHLQPEQPISQNQHNNMNLLWPGDPEGNEAARLAFALHRDVVSRCTCCLDIHCWSRFTASSALAREDVPQSVRMAEAAGFRFIELIGRPANPNSGMLGALFNSHGKTSATVELSGQWAVRETRVVEGLRCASNLAKLCGLFDGEPEIPEGPLVYFHQNTWRDSITNVMAPAAGLFVEADLHSSDHVRAGQKLGHLLTDDNLETIEIVAPVDGYLWNYGCFRADSDVSLPAMHPYADEGDVLAGIMAP